MEETKCLKLSNGKQSGPRIGVQKLIPCRFTLIACAFNFYAHSLELDRLGSLRIVKARMNPDLHMADELKNTGKGNLFVVFGEPDIDVATLDNGELQVVW